jgi:HAE1 family hydrophobic/amphiphilic exporter-1
MTSTTIACALFPTALRFGEGAELRAPLAAVVLGGVISSTLLTLVLVPVMYTLLDGLPTMIRGRIGAGVGFLWHRRSALRELPQTLAAAAGSNGHNGTNGHTPKTPEGAKPQKRD